MPQLVTEKKYKRILLKLSGEALTGSESFGIDPKLLDSMALAIGQFQHAIKSISLMRCI